MRRIDKLIVHCSATPNDRDVTVDEIRDWHLARGWSDIGYHYVIYRNGTIAAGRPVEKVGAHCHGQNAESIGVCLVGLDSFKPEQFDALKHVYALLKNIFPEIEPFGHRDFTDKKTCPNFEVRDWLCSQE